MYKFKNLEIGKVELTNNYQKACHLNTDGGLMLGSPIEILKIKEK